MFSRERPIKQDHMDLRIGHLNFNTPPATPERAAVEPRCLAVLAVDAA